MTEMTSKKSKKLYRSEKNRMIAGVAAGIAEYFEIDPVIVRLIFIFMSIGGGSGVFVYFILWLVIPSESDVKNSTEVNVKKGAKEIQSKAEDFAESVTKNHNANVILGIVLLIVGLLFLSSNFGFFNIFSLWKFWPLGIIVIGISLLLKSDGK